MAYIQLIVMGKPDCESLHVSKDENRSKDSALTHSFKPELENTDDPVNLAMDTSSVFPKVWVDT